MATYAVGDIQGCFEKLQELLDRVQFDENDTLWCAGDLINRGPDDLKTLRFLKNLGSRVVTVLGNHDLHLLACAYGARDIGKKDTFAEVLFAPDRDELIDWLRQQPLLHHDDTLNYSMVHAGIPPIWNLNEALDFAKEVETVLRSNDPRDYFKNMYGNEPTQWNNSLEGGTRLRTITNYFTRMRFCNPEGKLELRTKSEPSAPPSGYLPWYVYPKHRCASKRILFGHWAAMMGESGKPQFIGLDTGCIWGGQLTLMKLEDGERYCVDCSL